MLSDGLNKGKEENLFRRLRTHSDTETIALGYEIGTMLPINSIVCFFGDLGAGKTTFIKGIASSTTGCNKDQVNSPTFVYLNIYQGLKTVYHFDLYRLRDVDEFLSMGFEDYFFAGGITCIEWSEKVEKILPQNCIKVILKYIGNNEREVTIASSR
jgi:tRNA threonylcarbamoyladenosine biosynthesis protein TsaE